MGEPLRRRQVLLALAGAPLVMSTAPARPAVAAGARPELPPSFPGWKLRWAPAADRDGLAAFEHVEDDRANSDPAGFPHIVAEGDHYRVAMHLVDRDISTDRQRQEVRGMMAAGHALNLLDGDTWRFAWSVFIPDTLQATTRFTHISQLKAPGTDSLPILTMSLRRYGTVPKMELRITDPGVVVGAVDLAPLQNHWVDVTLDVTIGAAPDGVVRWAVRDGSTTVLDATLGGLSTWLFDRVRPKWGIYRSLGDTSGSLRDTFMLLRNLRAYQWSNSVVPPHVVRYEAEQATITGGTVDATYGGYTGTGYVNLVGVAGGSVRWTVDASWPGRAALSIWYANATTVSRPMDVTVNGELVAPALAFDRTPAWTDWESRTLLVNLRQGPNTVVVTAPTADGGPNVDSLEVQQPAVVVP